MTEQASARIDGCKLWGSVQLAWGNQPVSAAPRDLGTGHPSPRPRVVPVLVRTVRSRQVHLATK